MITTLTGSNDFVRKAELQKLIGEFVAKYSDFGLERIEAGGVEVGRLLESVASLPFLAERRMIVLSDVAANKPLAENIDKLLEATSDTTDLLIVEPKFDKRSVLYKTLKKKTDFKEFGETDDRALGNWLVSEASARGGKISASDAQYLLSRVGVNQLLLHNELDKLLAYDPTITRASIDLLTEPTPQSTVFNLLDAAFSGNTKRAMELYDEQRRQRVEPQAILGMLTWQIHILAVVKAGDMSKLSADDIARQAKLSPFVVRKTQAVARRLTLTQVKALVKRTLDLDVRLKSEPLDADDALQHYLLTLI